MVTAGCMIRARLLVEVESKRWPKEPCVSMVEATTGVESNSRRRYTSNQGYAQAA